MPDALAAGASFPLGGFALAGPPLRLGLFFLGGPAPTVECREFNGIGNGNQFEFLKGWAEHFS
jgi:hypothetical protein